MEKLFDYLFLRPNLIVAVIWSYVGHLFSDEIYLRVRFRLLMGKWPDLKTPKTFSEKLQWLKLYDRSPIYTTMVDKVAVKDYVSDIIGKEYIIPTLVVWNKVEDIDWEQLPNKFVIKTTHGAGSLGVVVCKDKAKLDRKKTISKLKLSMSCNAYRIQGEWQYKHVLHRIIAEQLIEPRKGDTDLPDYKFFCFNGVPKFCQVISGRGSEMCIDFFDMEWRHQPFHEPKDYPFAEQIPQKPVNLDKMWMLAGKLAEGMTFVRVDFYDVGDKVYFGEITFYPTSGFGGFDPDDYDRIMGEMIKLPANNNHYYAASQEKYELKN